MKSKFEQKLQQDGQSIKNQAENRLAKVNFEQQIRQKIETKSDQVKSYNNYYWSLAAAICLSVLVWSSVNIETSTFQTNKPVPFIAIAKINAEFKQLPNSIEEKINQPLFDEQQAIISDLKSLKQQLLSI